MLDPGLLIDPKSGEIRNGFPSLLAELMGIYKILYFNFEYLQDDWEPSMNVHELFKLRWITYLQMTLAPVTPLLTVPWMLVSGFNLMVMISYEVFVLDISFMD